MFPNATYVHCRSHILILAISSSCTSVPSIFNLFTLVHALTWFLTGSVKRKEILLEIASCNNSKDQQLFDFLKIGDEDDEFDESMVVIESDSKRHHIPKFCATRWSARVSTLSALIGKYITVFQTLEIEVRVKLEMIPLCTCGSWKIVSLLWHWLSLKLFLDFLV